MEIHCSTTDADAYMTNASNTALHRIICTSSAFRARLTSVSRQLPTIKLCIAMRVASFTCVMSRFTGRRDGDQGVQCCVSVQWCRAPQVSGMEGKIKRRMDCVRETISKIMTGNEE